MLSLPLCINSLCDENVCKNHSNGIVNHSGNNPPTAFLFFKPLNEIFGFLLKTCNTLIVQMHIYLVGNLYKILNYVKYVTGFDQINRFQTGLNLTFLHS